VARPSKLSESKWDEIGRKLHGGAKVADICREYKVSKSSVYGRFSEKVQKEKDVAQQILAAEQEFKALPISGQITVISILDELRAISSNLAGAAKNGSITAFRLSGIAARQVDKINEEDPMESQETLQAVSALTKMSNEAASLGISLIGINKEKMADPPDTAKNKLGVTLVLNRRADT
jgi:hypothetical protein